MRVSVSTLVEILKVTKESITGSAPKFVFIRAPEVQDPKAIYLVILIAFLLVLLLALVIAVVLLKGLLEREESPVAVQFVSRPTRFSVDSSLGADTKLQAFSSRNNADTRPAALEIGQRKLSSCDKSTECAEEHNDDLQEPTPLQKDVLEDNMRIPNSAGSPIKTQKLQTTPNQHLAIVKREHLLLFSKSN